MLLIDGQKKTAKEIFELYSKNLSFERFKKVPSFEMDKSRVRKDSAGTVKTNAGTRIRAKFQFMDNEGMTHDFVYAESENRKLESGVSVMKYEPRYIPLKGIKTEFKKKIDLAVFMYFQPSNPLSPFYQKGNIKNYEFIDNVKRAQATVNKVDALTKALQHASTLEGLEAVIFAKALGIPKVDDLYSDEPQVLYAHIKEYAMNNHLLYMEKAKTKVTLIEGKIVHGIDTGVFKLERIGNIRRWVWGKGAKQGINIVDITNTTQDAREALRIYILSNLGADNWMLNLDSAVMDDTAKEIAEKVLSGELTQKSADERIHEEVTEITPIVVDIDDMEIEFTEDKNAVKVILDGLRFDKEGKNAVWGDTTAFIQAYSEGKMTPQTARGWIRDNLGY